MNQIIFILLLNPNDNLNYLLNQLSSYNFKLKKIFTENIIGALIEIDSNQLHHFKNNSLITVIKEEEISKTRCITRYFNYELYKNLKKK